MEKLILYNGSLKNDLKMLNEKISITRESIFLFGTGASISILGSTVPHLIMKQYVSGTPLKVLSVSCAVLATLASAKGIVLLSEKITAPKYKKMVKEKEQPFYILLKEIKERFGVELTIDDLKTAEIETHCFSSHETSLKTTDVWINKNGKTYLLKQERFGEVDDSVFVSTSFETNVRERK